MNKKDRNYYIQTFKEIMNRKASNWLVNYLKDLDIKLDGEDGEDDAFLAIHRDCKLGLNDNDIRINIALEILADLLEANNDLIKDYKKLVNKEFELVQKVFKNKIAMGLKYFDSSSCITQKYFDEHDLEAIKRALAEVEEREYFQINLEY